MALPINRVTHSARRVRKHTLDGRTDRGRNHSTTMSFNLLNGESAQVKAEERQEKRQRHSQNIQQAAQSGDPNPDFVTKIVETGLDPGTANMLTNLLQSDWVLGNLDDAEVHEARWLARTIADEVYAMHPHEDSIWQGDLREYSFGDSSQNLTALNSAEKTKIFQLIQAFTVRVTRSEGMEQQEIFQKSISESRTVDDEESEKRWI